MIAAEPRDETLVREHLRGMSVFGERAAQFVGVPTGTGAEDGDVHDSSGP